MFALLEKGNERLHQPQILERIFPICKIKMVLEALSKGNRHPSHSITEEFAKLNNVSGANVNVKVCFNNKRQLDARKQNRPS